MSFLGQITGSDDAERAAREGQRLSQSRLEQSQAEMMGQIGGSRTEQNRLLGQGFDTAAQQAAGAAGRRQDFLREGAAGALSALGTASEGFDPYAQAGAGALDQLGQLSGSPISVDMAADPGVRFRQQQQQQALQRQQAAGGTSMGGGALRELARYSQNLASQEYGAAFNRSAQERQMQLQGLSGLAGMGMQATAGQAGLAGQQAGVHTGLGAGLASQDYDASQMTLAELSRRSDLESGYLSATTQAQSNLGSGLAGIEQNLGDIGAAGATADFTNLTAMGTTAGGLGWSPLG